MILKGITPHSRTSKYTCYVGIVTLSCEITSLRKLGIKQCILWTSITEKKVDNMSKKESIFYNTPKAKGSPTCDVILIFSLRDLPPIAAPSPGCIESNFLRYRMKENTVVWLKFLENTRIRTSPSTKLICCWSVLNRIIHATGIEVNFDIFSFMKWCVYIGYT